VPSLVWSESIRCDADLRGHYRFEFVVGDFQESQQLANQHPYVALIDQCETEIESSSPDTDIGVTQAVQNRVPVALNRIGLNGDNLDQSVERNVSNVVVTVRQEFTENVHAEHAETRVCLDVKNSKYCLIQNRVSDVFRRVRVCSDLRKLAEMSSREWQTVPEPECH
jgi:hypothetical protein